MARDPLLLEILTTLRGQNDTMAHVRVDMATMAANLLAMANLPSRVDALEKQQLKQQAFINGGLWVWAKVVAATSAVVSTIMFILHWMGLLPK
jgi:hypothetical protein